MLVYKIVHNCNAIFVKVYENSWVLKFFPKHIAGVTLGKRVFCRGVAKVSLLRHEFTHIKQITDLGIVKFYWQYLCYFISGLRVGKSWDEAYRAIPFEVEAYNSKVDE